MQQWVDWIKIKFHQDLVKTPIIHGWILNLYRAGEAYPQTVDDYFPWQIAPSKILAAQIKAHEYDERRHTELLTRTLLKMGEPLLQLSGHDVYNATIRILTPISFKVLSSDSKEIRTLKLAHFLTHAHHLEKRVLRSLEYHYEACEQARCFEVAKVIHSIATDEARHVSYTGEVAKDLLPLTQMKNIFKIHKRAESQANLRFSRHQVNNFLARYSREASLPSRWLYQFSSWVMGMAEATF